MSFRSVVFSPDSKMLASAAGGYGLADGNSLIRLWYAATGKEIRQLQGPETGLLRWRFLPTAKTGLRRRW